MKTITPYKLINLFYQKKIDNFFGVPDSVLKNLVSIINPKKNIICANEGLAVSMAIGNYLAKKKICAVYMQNSGLGNAINPLISLAHRSVYSIPMILIIGWRGHDGKSDEPQHNTKGKITKKILNLLNIKNVTLSSDHDINKLAKLLEFSKNKKVPVAVLIKSGILSKTKNYRFNNNFKVARSNFFKILLSNLPKESRIISSTGFNSRELYQIRKKYNLENGKDFYLIGGMGHTFALSLGYALKSNKKTICIDGDGSLFMHLGSLVMLKKFNLKNFKYILLNNQCHESVGSQKTYSENINFKNLATLFNFKKYCEINNEKDIRNVLEKFLKYNESSFLLVNIKNKSMENLGRPKNFKKIKNLFIK